MYEKLRYDPLTHPLHIAKETEDIEELVSIDLGGLQTVHHNNGGVRMRTIFRGRRPISGAVTLGTTAAPTSHGGSHAPSLIVRGRGPVAVIIIAVITSLGTTLYQENVC